MPLTEEAKRIAEAGFYDNAEIRNAIGVPGRLGRLLGKELAIEGV